MSSKDNLTPAELCERWSGVIKEPALTNWRSQNKGPGYIKIGSRVLYPMSEILAYEQEQKKGGLKNG